MQISVMTFPTSQYIQGVSKLNVQTFRGGRKPHRNVFRQRKPDQLDTEMNQEAEIKSQ